MDEVKQKNASAILKCIKTKYAQQITVIYCL